MQESRTPIDWKAVGKRSRTKGNVFERTVANVLKRIWPDAKRSFGQSRKGDETPDVVGTPFWIETTASASPNLMAKLAQAEKARRESPGEYAQRPIIVFANHQGKTKRVVLMLESEFMDVLTRAYGKQQSDV